ncbi:beta-propeller domain-containing protein [Pyrodictium abyssi]|uniref:Beta propeller domain protein n=1 Tax=Pyrodictium abyssi TaxID=54256 RepID=A0ABM8IZ35_9CREN|nr:hypothetical protein PABY_17440 [Pyrodictium abyssi]
MRTDARLAVLLLTAVAVSLAAGYLIGAWRSGESAQPEAGGTTYTTTVATAPVPTCTPGQQNSTATGAVETTTKRPGSGVPIAAPSGPNGMAACPVNASRTVSLEWTGYGYRAPWEDIEAVRQYLLQAGKAGPVYPIRLGVAVAEPGALEAAVQATLEQLAAQAPITLEVQTEAAMSSPAQPEYSATNVQVAGVDEPDIVKTNGTHIAVATGRRVELYRAYPPGKLGLAGVFDAYRKIMEFVGDERLVLVSDGHMEPVAPVQHYVRVRGLYMEGGRLIVLAEEARSPWPLEPRTWIIALSPSLEPLWIRSITGSFYDARLYNGTLVVVTSTGSLVRPMIVDAIASRVIPAPEPPVIVGPGATETIVAAFSTETGNAATLTLIGAQPSAIYMPASGSLYLVLPGVEELHGVLGDRLDASIEDLLKKLESVERTLYRSLGKSLLVRVAVGHEPRLEAAASTVVPGLVRKQWMLDEYNGMLRVVLEEQSQKDGRRVTKVSLYILDAGTLKEVGRLDEVVVDERVHAVRFLGPRLYLVTFRQVDPLFAIDLSDPENPRVLGFLEAPGFDEYIHPVNETLLVGVGREGPRLRISLYRVHSDARIEVLSRVYIGSDKQGWSYAWSPVLDPRWGHRAFTLDARHGYILVPVSGVVRYYVAGVVNGKTVTKEVVKPKSGVAVVKLDEAAGKLGLVAILEHRDAARSLYIDDAIYTVSPGSLPRIKAFDAETLKPIAYAPRPVEASIRDIREDPQSYQGRLVKIEGMSLGWSGLDEPPPVTRSDWVLSDGTGRIYVAATRGPIPSYGEKVTVIGTVRISGGGQPYIEPAEVIIER